MWERLAQNFIPLCILVSFATYCFWQGIKLVLIPRSVATKHEQLRKAMKAANTGKASEEQLALLKDAERAGLAVHGLAGMKVDGRTGQLVVETVWRYTDEGIRQLYAGQYFSAADIQEEMDQYKIKT